MTYYKIDESAGGDKNRKDATTYNTHTHTHIHKHTQLHTYTVHIYTLNTAGVARTRADDDGVDAEFVVASSST